MNKSSSPKTKQTFYQVWNDSVVIKDLVIAMIINIVLTVIFLYSAIYILSAYVTDPNIMKGYSLLIGLIGCVLGAIICMKLFKPKRVIETDVENNDNLYTVITGFVDYTTEHSISTLPNNAKEELKTLGMYELFIKAEQEANTKVKEDN